MDDKLFKELNEKADALRKEILEMEYTIRKLAIFDMTTMREQVAEKKRLLDEYSMQSFQMVKQMFGQA
jgi:hypothetical protein